MSTFNDVFSTNAVSGWAVGENGIIVRTRGGGQAWDVVVDSTVTHSLEKIVFKGATGWAIGFDGTIPTCTDAASPRLESEKPILQKRN